MSGPKCGDLGKAVVGGRGENLLCLLRAVGAVIMWLGESIGVTFDVLPSNNGSAQKQIIGVWQSWNGILKVSMQVKHNITHCPPLSRGPH